MKAEERIAQSEIRVKSGMRLIGCLLLITGGAFALGVVWLIKLAGVAATFFGFVTALEYWNIRRLKEKQGSSRGPAEARQGRMSDALSTKHVPAMWQRKVDPAPAVCPRDPPNEARWTRIKKRHCLSPAGARPGRRAADPPLKVLFCTSSPTGSVSLPFDTQTRPSSRKAMSVALSAAREFHPVDNACGSSTLQPDEIRHFLPTAPPGAIRRVRILVQRARLPDSHLTLPLESGAKRAKPLTNQGAPGRMRDSV